MYPPKLYSGLTIQSRSAAQRAAQDLVNIKVTKRDSSRVELSRFLGIFGIVSTDLRLTLLIFVADVHVLFTKSPKNCKLNFKTRTVFFSTILKQNLKY